MTETKPKRRWLSFSIRELLLFTAILGLALAWWMDHRRLTTFNGVPAQLLDQEMAKDNIVATLRRSIDILKAKVVYPDSKELVTPDEIRNQIQRLQERLEQRELMIRPIITRQLIADFNYWREDRSASQVAGSSK